MPTPPVKFPKPNRSPGKPPVRKNDGNGSAPGPGSDQNWRGLILIFLTVLSMFALYYALKFPGIAQQEMTQAQLFQLIKDGRVTTIVNEPDPFDRQFACSPAPIKSRSAPLPAHPTREKALSRCPSTSNSTPTSRTKSSRRATRGLSRPRTTPTGSWPLLINFLPVLFVFGIIYFLFRQQIRMAGKGAFSFGKSKARMLTRDRNKITFKDVAGIDEAKEEVSAKSSNF